MRITFFVLFALFNSYLFAQNKPWCESAEYLQEMLAKDPELAERFNQSRNELQQYQSSGNKQGRTLVTIPVVVHVVHDGDAVGASENLSDAQIQSQIDALNQDYRNLNPATSTVPQVFKSLVADFEIEFCLASRDPDGNPSNGIDRINGGRITWDKTQADAFKPSTIWDRNQYLNIWTMRLGGTNANTLGYAQFPGMPDSTDGIVIDYIAFGTTGSVNQNYNKGKTTTHEVGHWLGLFHIWGDDQGACTMDDGVGDTPNQASENFGCPTFPHVSCTNGPNGDMFMNYMDYTDDGCSAMFTLGQKTVADFTLSSARLSIQSSMGCVPTTVNQLDMAITNLIFPISEICTDVFVPVIEVRNHGGAAIWSMLINYQLDGAGLNQYFWSGNIPSLEYEYISLPELTQSTGQHSIAIYLSSINGGIDQHPGNEDVSLNFEIVSIGAGIFIPASENFESGSLPADWQLNNPNGDRSWVIITSSGASGTGTSARFDNFSGSASNNPRGKRDGLITPEYDFHTSIVPYVTFEVAYARKSSSSKDSLIVYYSANCGSSWTRVYAKGGSDLATAPDVSTAFVPQPGEWRKETIWMNLLANQSKIQFMFENYSDFGNDIYVDEFIVNVTPTPVGIGNSPSKEFELEIVPNPNDGKFKLILSDFPTSDLRIELYNSSGQKIESFDVKQSNDRVEGIDLSGFPAGLYFARVFSSNFAMCRKILVGR